MNILVTGSSGFIASYLIPLLKSDGHNVFGVDIKQIMSNNDVIKHDEHGCIESRIMNDVRNRHDCYWFTGNIDCVVHLAARVDVQESVNAALPYYETNLTGTLNMLEAARINNVKRFVYISSAAADRPTSPYGATKLDSELWCNLYNECYGLSTISLRPYNVYGKGNGKGVIDTWANRIKEGRELVVYGGNQVRDFVYIKDVANAIMQAISSKSIGVCEVGTGRGVSILKLAMAMQDVSGIKVGINIKEPKDNEINVSYARHLEHTKKWIGWYPKYSLEQGLSEMLADLKE